MATQNFFALLGDDENDDPSVLIERAGAAAAVAAKELNKQQPQKQAAPAKLPSKPLPPAQAVRESQNQNGRGRGGRGGRGGRDNRDSNGNYSRPNRNGYGGEQQDAYGNGYANGESLATGEEGGRQRVRGGYRGRGRGFGNSGDGTERQGHREYERRSGTGRGNEMKRDGSGKGNWGVETDQVVPEAVVEETDPNVNEKKPDEASPESEDAVNKVEEEEKEKEMTLEEYEKLLDEKRKPLVALKAKERTVTIDKEFESMQLVEKKAEEEIFLKLGSDKLKKKESAEKEEKSKKPLNINEFLKTANGDGHLNPFGRRGRGGRGRGGRGGYGAGSRDVVPAPKIEDQIQFPILAGK